MTNMYEFTNEEWATLSAAPGIVGEAVAKAASSGLLGEWNESRTITQRISSTPDDNPAKSLIDAVGDPDYKQQLKLLTHGIPQSPEAIADIAVAICTDANTILNDKATSAEATGFKTWLLDIATEVAKTAKEDGIRFSPAEVAVVERLTAALELGKPLDT